MRFSRTTAVIFTVALASHGFAQDRVAVPASSDQRAAEKSLRDLFEDDYARKRPEDRRDLARKLLENALKSGDESAVLYVMLRDARSFAVEGGDLETLEEAIDEMARVFEIDALEARKDDLTKFASKIRGAEAAAETARAFLRLSRAAVQAGDVDAAFDAAKKAETIARASRNASVQAQAKEMRALATFVRSEYSKVKRHEKTLEKSPDDPRANLAVGKFVCFIAGDWARGLPMLAKGSDAVLKQVAKTDLSSPEESRAQTSLGDMWWNVAEKERGAQRKDRVRSRAFYWYGLGVEETSGIARMKIEKRLRTAKQFIAPPGASLQKTQLIGGSGGADFQDAPEPRAPLVGLRVSITSIIKSVQPVFRSGGKKTLGKTYGGASGEPLEIVARPGYAVGAIIAKGAARVDGLRIVFMRIQGMQLDKSDSYESEWHGGTGGGPETTITGEGSYVVGIHGRAADDLDCMGLVYLK